MRQFEMHPFCMTLNCLIFDSASPSGYDSFPIFSFRKTSNYRITYGMKF